MTESQQYVTGLYANEKAAEQAVRNLLEANFSSDQIGILLRDPSGVEEVPVRHETGVGAGLKAAGGLGVALGGIGAALVSVGTLPALGLGLVAAGPVAAAASGAVAGGAGGGLLGALAGLGFWTETPELPDQLNGGAVLVSIPAFGEHAEVGRRALEDAGAEWVQG